METAKPVIHVVAGVLADRNGRVLIAQRPAGKHLAGSWEFPGGKSAPQESSLEALRRELSEELGVQTRQARPLIRYRHAYPEFAVDLDVWRVESWSGEPRSLEGQALDWVMPNQLMEHDLLPADRPVALALLLPESYLITGTIGSDDELRMRLGAALERGAKLVQLRVPNTTRPDLERLAGIAAADTSACSCSLLINGEPRAAYEVARQVHAAGIHVPSRYLSAIPSRPVPESALMGASVHNASELADAVRLRADFAVLGPVLATASHPDAPTLGWQGFERLVSGQPLPVYALGGVSEAHLHLAWKAGAQGVAGISAFW
ncbi:MAG: Nudix family hydrolase [Gammaproteobacteria bacterium]|nr:MAG: Nudix family hydrolase [Gammaproteobacteria bacterium]